MLSQQLPCGAWQPYATPADGILNTVTALLSLKKRLRERPKNHDWLLRAKKGEAALRQTSLGWNMHSTDQVGFETLIISLLGLLEQESVCVSFPQFDALGAVYNTELAKLPVSGVYERSSTLYNSLEALIGHIDFDRIGQ